MLQQVNYASDGSTVFVSGANPCTSSSAAAAVISSRLIDAPENNDGIQMQTNAWPNPTENFFYVVVKGSSQEVAEIKVYDMLGRVLDHKRVATGEVIQLGSRYTQGMYLIEILQGNERRILKVIKK